MNGCMNVNLNVAAAGHVCEAKVISHVLLFSPQERLTGGLGLLLPSLEK